MKYAPADEPNQEQDQDNEEQPTSIVGSVGSGAVGSADIEPQDEPRPDNDGETVEDE